MARSFNGSSDSLWSLTAPITAAPFTMACWFNSTTGVGNQTLIDISDGSTSDRWRLNAAGNVGGDPIRCVIAQTGQSNVNVDTSTGYSANTWHHACFVERSATDRSIYIDGGSRGNNATSRTPGGISEITVGTSVVNSQYLNGLLAEAAVWSADLTDDEITALALGVSPLIVRPASLVSYWPLVGRTSPEIDTMGGNGLIVSGAVAAVHPRVFYPSRVQIGVPAAAVAANDGAALYHHFRNMGVYA